MDDAKQIEQRIDTARSSFDDLRAEMARGIVGHEELIEQVFSPSFAAATVCSRACRGSERL